MLGEKATQGESRSGGRGCGRFKLPSPVRAGWVGPNVSRTFNQIPPRPVKPPKPHPTITKSQLPTNQPRSHTAEYPGPTPTRGRPPMPHRVIHPLLTLLAISLATASTSAQDSSFTYSSRTPPRSPSTNSPKAASTGSSSNPPQMATRPQTSPPPRSLISNRRRCEKTVLAYLSIGEAESYRDYFNPAWLDARATPTPQPPPYGSDPPTPTGKAITKSATGTPHGNHSSWAPRAPPRSTASSIRDSTACTSTSSMRTTSGRMIRRASPSAPAPRPAPK